MDSLRLSSAGFAVGSLVLPAFQLRAGECLCLHFPEDLSAREVEQVIGILTGEIPLPSIRLWSRVVWAAPPRPGRLGLLNLFRPMRVADWLARIGGASPTQVQTFLQQLHPQERHCRIEQLPGTPRSLLSLEAAWLAAAQVVVFTTAGLDPLGRETVYAAVSSHFPQASAIHLSFFHLEQGQRKRQCFAGTTCLELRRLTKFSLAITTSPEQSGHA
jgi:hypothetical protein